MVWRRCWDGVGLLEEPGVRFSVRRLCLAVPLVDSPVGVELLRRHFVRRLPFAVVLLEGLVLWVELLWPLPRYMRPSRFLLLRSVRLLDSLLRLVHLVLLPLELLLALEPHLVLKTLLALFVGLSIVFALLRKRRCLVTGCPCVRSAFLSVCLVACFLLLSKHFPALMILEANTHHHALPSE